MFQYYNLIKIWKSSLKTTSILVFNKSVFVGSIKFHLPPTIIEFIKFLKEEFIKLRIHMYTNLCKHSIHIGNNLLENIFYFLYITCSIPNRPLIFEYIGETRLDLFVKSVQLFYRIYNFIRTVFQNVGEHTSQRRDKIWRTSWCARNNPRI